MAASFMLRRFNPWYLCLNMMYRLFEMQSAGGRRGGLVQGLSVDVLHGYFLITEIPIRLH